MPKQAALKSLDEQLKAASLRFAEQIADIVRSTVADEIAQLLGARLQSSGSAQATTAGRKKRKPMSAEAKKILSEKMKARWAARKRSAKKA